MYSKSEMQLLINIVSLTVVLIASLSMIINFTKKHNDDSLNLVKLDRKNVIISLLGLLLLLLVFFIIIPNVNHAITHNQTAIATNIKYARYLFIWPVFSVFIAPIYEELICRWGIMQNPLLKNNKYYLDVITASIFFAVPHLISGFIIFEFTLYFIMGLIFSVIMRLTKHIQYPIMTHIIYNLIGIIVKIILVL